MRGEYPDGVPPCSDLSGRDQRKLCSQKSMSSELEKHRFM